MDMLISKQHERQHLPIRSGCQVLFCIGNSHDGPSPSRMVLHKAFSCTKKADSEALFKNFLPLRDSHPSREISWEQDSL